MQRNADFTYELAERFCVMHSDLFKGQERSVWEIEGIKSALTRQELLNAGAYSAICRP